MWYGLLLLAVCGIVLIFLAQLRLWRAAASLANRRPSWLLFLPALFLSAAMLLGLSAFYRLRGLAASGVEETPLLYVLLDCSVSMTAEAWPGSSRLDAAKKVLRQLPSVLDGWELALVTFAGEPFLDFPPSTDHRGWLAALEAVSPESPPLSGSSPGRGLQLVAETSALCASGKAVILLFSDGEVNVENPELEAAFWHRRALPCLFVLTGVPGERKAIPDPSGWLSAKVAPGEALSVSDDQEMRRLLGLSASPFQVIKGQLEGEDILRLSDELRHLIRKSSGQRGIAAASGGNLTLFFLLLAALCAMLTIFCSGYGLPKLSMLLLLAVLGGVPLTLPAGEEPALELCREAVQKTGQPDELRRAIGLYRQALHLHPGLELAARNLEYTLLQLQKKTISRQKKSTSETKDSSADQQKEKMGEVPPVPGEADGLPTTMVAGEQAEPSGRTPGKNSATWRELQTRRRRIFRVPLQCNPW